MLVIAAGGSSSAVAGDGIGKLAYVVSGGGARDRIVAENIDGTSVHRLLPPARYGWSHFEWAPDGSQIFATRNARGFFPEELLVTADGGQPRRVAHGPWIGSVRWSPDSSRLAFVRLLPKSCAGAVWVVNSDGAKLRRVTHPPNRRSWVSLRDWSPDGTRLLYTTTTYYDDECPRAQYATRALLITINADGSGRKVVARIPDEVWDAAWSPDGSQIAYSRCDFVVFLLPCQLWVVDLASGTQRKVGTPVNMWDGGFGIRWTRDGRELLTAFECGPTQCVLPGEECDEKTWSGGLRAVDVATGTTRIVVRRNGCTSVYLRAMSHDGQTVAVTWSARASGADDVGPTELVGLDGTNVRPIAEPVADRPGAEPDPFVSLYLP